MGQQKSMKESLYFELGKMMGKRAVEKLKRSNMSKGDLQKLKDNAARFLIKRIVLAE
jgi:hypothetical protein